MNNKNKLIEDSFRVYEFNNDYRKVFMSASEIISTKIASAGVMLSVNEGILSQLRGVGSLYSMNTGAWNQFSGIGKAIVVNEDKFNNLTSIGTMLSANKGILSNLSTENPLLNSLSSIKMIAYPGEKILKQLESIRSSISINNNISSSIESIMKSVKLSEGICNQFESIKSFSMTHDKFLEGFKSIEMLGISAQILMNQIQSLNLDDIEIDKEGNINYLDEPININSTLEDINLEIKNNSSIIEYLCENIKNFSAIKLIAIYIFVFMPLINTYINSDKMISDNNTIEYNLNTNVEEISTNICYGLDTIEEALIAMQVFALNSLKELNSYAQNNPIIYDILKWIIPGIFIYAGRKIKEYKNQYKGDLKDKNKFIKFIKNNLFKSIRDEYNNNLVNDVFSKNFGIIKSESLDVRTSNKLRAPIIYKLSLGDIVNIIEKHDDWTKVAFQGSDENNYSGWVLSRYISKFN